MNDDRNRYIVENDEVEDPEEDEVEEAPPPDFDVGDLCVTRVPIKRNFGTIPEGLAVEVKRKFVRSKTLHYDVETLPGVCPFILKINAVSIDLLEDYDNVHPSI